MKARPLIDKLIVVVAVTFCVIGIGRAVLGVSALPYSVGVVALESRSGSPEAARGWGAIFDQASLMAYDHPLYMQWWGSRRRPRVAGDDYLKALAKRPLDRILGIVLGEVVRRASERGEKIDLLVMPNDLGTLVGTESAASFERADGTIAKLNLRHPEQEFEWLSEVPAERRDYYPLISTEEAAELRSKLNLRRETIGVWIDQAGPDVSGTWILYSSESATLRGGRQFFLVPIEVRPPGASR